MYYKTTAYRYFYAANLVLLSLVSVVCILPLVHILAISFSSKAPANANIVGLWPIDFTADSYSNILNNGQFLISMWISAKRLVMGTVLGMIITLLSAYPLSKRETVFKGKTFYTWIFVFTLLFNGGIIPSYIVVQKMGLMNSIWSLVLPVLVSAWNIILMLNFFKTIPKEMEEAAFIDGANHFKTLLRIYLPISMPAIATLSLFTMVWHWNSWFDGLIYVTDASNWPLSTLLQNIVVQEDFTKLSINPEQLQSISNKTVKAAQIFVGALPILLVYPFLQKYFVKGMVIGAVKE